MRRRVTGKRVILGRALARRDGQLQALQHWRQGARLAGLLLLVLAVVSGAGLAIAALGNGERPVNLFWALGSLLGLHLLMLLGWALSFGLGSSASVLGRLWLWLSGKLARDAQAAHPPAVVKRHRPRILYATQGATDPPTFTLFATRSLAPQYLRYLERKLREAFDLGPSPIKIRVRRRNE